MKLFSSVCRTIDVEVLKVTVNVSFNGKHIGFVAKTFPENQHLFMVALTSLTIEEIALDNQQIKGYLGRVFGFTNMFGRLQEDRLHEFLESKRTDKYKEAQINNSDDFLRFFFLKVADERGYDLEKLFHWEEIEPLVKGYLLINVETAKFSGATIELEEINYFSEETVGEGMKPIFASIIDYPIYRTDIMGAAEGFFLGANFSDFGGRNHAHETVLRIRSGNYEKTISFPIQMYVKKGMPIQLYLQEGKIKRIFCGDAIYEF